VFNLKTDKVMKKYMKPHIEQLDVELEQMIAGSTLDVDLNNDDAGVTDGFYNDSRDDLLFI
jgi:hypothetical protein